MNKSTKVSYLLNQPKYEASVGRPQLLRIEFNPEYTKIDFGYQTTDYYVKGGWVKIAPITYIKVNTNQERLTLTNSINIPIAPEKHDFETKKDWLYFSLIFPPIKIEDCLMDMIEADKGEPTDFNYYNIEIKKSDLIELKK